MAWTPINNSDYQFESGVYPKVMNLFIFTDSTKKITSIIWNIKLNWLIKAGKLNKYFKPLYPLFIEDCGPEKDEYYYEKTGKILDSLITYNQLPYVVFGRESFMAIIKEAGSISFQIFTAREKISKNTLISRKDFLPWDSLMNATLVKQQANFNIWEKDSVIITEKHNKFNNLLSLVKYYLTLAGKYGDADVILFNTPTNPYHRLYYTKNKFAFITIKNNDVINIEIKNLNFSNIDTILRILFK